MALGTALEVGSLERDGKENRGQEPDGGAGSANRRRHGTAQE